MTNKTVTMSRELAGLLFRALNGGDNQLTGMEHGVAFRELRALLAAPECEFHGADSGSCETYSGQVPCASAPIVERQPSAWLHTMFMDLDQQRSVPTLNPEHPFGICGKDFSPSYTVQSDALYTATPAPALPDNLESHRNTWIQAMERLVELEPESCAPDEDEKGFWRHELQAMRDMYTDLDKLQAKPPCP
jgi:hypothetical protein